jgi:hypothetical protein
MILANATVAQNQVIISGGGILNSGNLEITNSTVSHNSAIFGGGLAISGGTTVILNATIAENTSRLGVLGGGISGDPVILQNTILARNSGAFPGGSDCTDVVTSLGNNLIGGPDRVHYHPTTQRPDRRPRLRHLHG